jgi:alpha-L-fucosidase
MKYFVITTKHHEGFCLWDTAYTWYKAPNTPYGKDLLKPMVEAFREEGLKVGFYHSLLDWHHPHYTVDHCHPMRDNPEYIAQDKERNLDLYVEYLYKQSEELVTKFGKIDILWYDFSVAKSDRFEGKGKDQWRSEKLIELVRKHQPDIIINDRLQIDQDIKTPEQYQPREWLKVNGKPVVWEACQTFSGSWGYNRDEESWKSVDMLVQMLIDTVSKGGNMLLNVGPTARGEFDDRALERLKGIGTWMKRHGRSIYGCTQAPDEYICPRDCRYTYNPKTKTLYLHVFAWPFKHLFLDGMADKVEYAQLLNDASEIIMKKTDNNGLVLNLPVKKPNVTVPVIELFLK